MAAVSSGQLHNVIFYASFTDSFLFVSVFCSWVSVLQNSKEEALNTALGGDQLHVQDSGLQELSRAIIAELRQMPGNEACADCGAPGQKIYIRRWREFTLICFGSPCNTSPVPLRSNMAFDKFRHSHLH